MTKIIKTKYGKARINSNGYYLISTAREGNFEKYLHRLIYEEHYGEIPKGHFIHHKNGNKLDNRIENLEAISHAEHTKLHSIGNKYWLGKKHTDETKEKLRKAHTLNYASIIKRGKNKYGKQKYSVRYGRTCIKHSVNVSSLVDWFTNQYPTVILKLSGVFL